MANLTDRLQELMQLRGWDHADLVRVSGQSSSVVSQWLGKGSKVIHSIGKLEAAENLEVASGFAALWIAKGIGPKFAGSMERNQSTTQSRGGTALQVSQLAPQDAPTITLGKLLKIDLLPAVFWAALPDDAMAPRAPAGKLICFDRLATPRPGDGVLVVDEVGAFHFRLYRAGPAGRWVAGALNPAYQDLDSQRDALRLVAVLKAEEGRWG